MFLIKNQIIKNYEKNKKIKAKSCIRFIDMVDPYIVKYFEKEYPKLNFNKKYWNRVVFVMNEILFLHLELQKYQDLTVNKTEINKKALIFLNHWYERTIVYLSNKIRNFVYIIKLLCKNDFYINVGLKQFISKTKFIYFLLSNDNERSISFPLHNYCYIDFNEFDEKSIVSYLDFVMKFSNDDIKKEFNDLLLFFIQCDNLEPNTFKLSGYDTNNIEDMMDLFKKER